MRSRLTTHLLRCAVIAPTVIAGAYTAGLATVVADVHLFERALLERAPRTVFDLAHSMYGSFVDVYELRAIDCWR